MARRVLRSTGTHLVEKLLPIILRGPPRAREDVQPRSRRLLACRTERVDADEVVDDELAHGTSCRAHAVPQRRVALEEKDREIRAALLECREDALDNVHNVQRLRATTGSEERVGQRMRDERVAVDSEGLRRTEFGKKVAVHNLDRAIGEIHQLVLGRAILAPLRCLVIAFSTHAYVRLVARPGHVRVILFALSRRGGDRFGYTAVLSHDCRLCAPLRLELLSDPCERS
jgi:hypothetical protein